MARCGQFVTKSLHSFACLFFAIDFLRTDVLLSRGFDRAVEFKSSTTFQQNPSFMAFIASSRGVHGSDAMSLDHTTDISPFFCAGDRSSVSSGGGVSGRVFFCDIRPLTEVPMLAGVIWRVDLLLDLIGEDICGVGPARGGVLQRQTPPLRRPVFFSLFFDEITPRGGPGAPRRLRVSPPTPFHIT